MADRRFELGIGPLTARLGYTRPDEDPWKGGDCVYPAMVVGDYRGNAVSPGSRVQVITGHANAQALSKSTVRFRAVDGGCWLHSITPITDDGSLASMWTSNEDPGQPAIAATGGSSEMTARFDDREEFGAGPVVDVGSIGGAGASLHRFGGVQFYQPVWWTTTLLYVQGTVDAVGLTAWIVVERALQGMRRQTL